MLALSRPFGDLRNCLNQTAGSWLYRRPRCLKCWHSFEKAIADAEGLNERQKQHRSIHLGEDVEVLRKRCDEELQRTKLLRDDKFEQSTVSEYNTSLKVYRKVYKDSIISYNASCYQVSSEMVQCPSKRS